MNYVLVLRPWFFQRQNSLRVGICFDELTEEKDAVLRKIILYLKNLFARGFCLHHRKVTIITSCVQNYSSLRNWSPTVTTVAVIVTPSILKVSSGCFKIPAFVQVISLIFSLKLQVAMERVTFERMVSTSQWVVDNNIFNKNYLVK